MRLAQLCNMHKDDLESAIASHGMEDQTRHFIPRRCYRGEKGWMWGMRRYGRPVVGKGGYIFFSVS